ncbi:hypothetical protein [Pseudomonas kitaguniensis]|uniref:hypothetical protein n=1 Tax=Pseudomonas kitaguniensis TaxID=2607908 RepID=UPI003D032F8F
MNFFSVIKRFIIKNPKEQVVGYSLSELKSIFTEPLPPPRHALFQPPRAVSLEDAGVSAYYASLLIDKRDINKVLALVESSLKLVTERTFNDLPVKRYEGENKHQKLIVCTSAREFNSITLQVVTNSVDFLDAVRSEELPVPPPWIAFEGYNASWWGENMQGAQGYYNDNYFFPFFTALSAAERRAYYAKYKAADEWINSLELMRNE